MKLVMITLDNESMQSGENKSYFVYHVIFNIFLVCVCTDFPAAFYVLYTVRHIIYYFFYFSVKKYFQFKNTDFYILNIKSIISQQNKTQKYISLCIYIIYLHTHTPSSVSPTHYTTLKLHI